MKSGVPRPRHFRRFSQNALFAKLGKAIIILVTSVRPPAWNNSAPPGRIFMKFDI